MKESEMRFPYLLVLGLTFALLSGCSHCENCRTSMQTRFACGRNVGQRCAVSSSLIKISPTAQCARVSEHGNPEHIAAPKEELDSNAPIKPETHNGEDDASVEVPKVLSSTTKKSSQGASKLQATIEPTKVTHGLLFPSRLKTRKVELPSVPPEVAEISMPSHAKPVTTPEPGFSVLNPSELDANVSVPEGDRKRPEGLLTSTSQESSAEPRLIHETRPVPFGVDSGSKARLDATLSKRNRFGSSDELVPQLLTVIDANTVDAYGMPSGTTVPFKQLPPIQESQNGTRLGSVTPLGSVFQEPPLDDQVPEFQSLPVQTSQDDPFTSTTSYQVPMRDEMFGNGASGFIEVQNSTDRKSDTNDLEAIQTPVDSVFRIIPRSTEPRTSSVQILRLRAATPIDQKVKFPPIVNINVSEPIIIRSGIHPTAETPEVVVESPYSTIPSRPVFDEKRLEESIRGLTARPENASTKMPQTIER